MHQLRPTIVPTMLEVGRLPCGGRAKDLVVAAALGLAAILMTTGARTDEFRRESHLVETTHMEAAIPVEVLVPAGPPSEGGWPVLYLLHGLGGTERSLLRLGHADEALSALVADGTIEPPLVVMPGLGDAWYVDSGPKRAAQAAFLDDVVPWIDASYAVTGDPGRTALVGLSMGGYGALRFALLRPDRFGSVAALFPAIWQNAPEADLDLPPERLNVIRDSRYFQEAPDETVVQDVDLPNPGAHFSGAFGDPFDTRRFNALNVFTFLQEGLEARETMPRMMVTVGDDDSDAHGLWRGAIALFETVRSEEGAIELRVGDGGHDWAYWRSAFPEAAAFALAPLAAGSTQP